MDDYLAKPLDRALLDDMLRWALGISGRPSGIGGMSAAAGDSEPDGEPPVLDAGSLAEICDGDDDARDQLVAMFADQAGDAVADLCRALGTDDLPAARICAHALTGSAATVGAERIAAVARRICDDITTGHPTDATADQAELRRALALTLAALPPAATPGESSPAG
jgi:HPt (histidine-containing phosphotransfer) domain-containing protein